MNHGRSYALPQVSRLPAQQSATTGLFQTRPSDTSAPPLLPDAGRYGCQLDTHPYDCTLIGDSVTDVEAAKATGGRSIGFANKPGKERALGDAGADAVVTSMATVAEALGSPEPPLSAPSGST
ncbi:HAD hydrolase-like protein [Streptomyces sp. NPDC047022]|uniref:HAD family hydrolase n=1 Tax=Streptomyces sp. NPDC047022 TaxID=3155737 RepID=UPI0033ED496A